MVARNPGKFTVMAVASGGGHWEELMLLKPSLCTEETVFVTTNGELAQRDQVDRIGILPDSNRDEPVQALFCLIHSCRLVWAVRPDVLITTGALPGLFCLIAARLTGAKTIWIDSIAASDKPSLSGRCARLFASLWLTQWPHLAGVKGIAYEGALL